MFKSIYKINFFINIFLPFFYSFLRAEIIDKINIEGNQRISSETIKMFAGCIY